MLRKIPQLSIHRTSIVTVVDADQAAAFNSEFLNGMNTQVFLNIIYI
jgi:hypothetical protein